MRSVIPSTVGTMGQPFALIRAPSRVARATFYLRPAHHIYETSDALVPGYVPPFRERTHQFFSVHRRAPCLMSR
jgi:hypothetical protein